MQMKLKDAIDRAHTMSEISELVLPIKVSYAVTYNLEQLENEAHRADHKRIDLCKQYAEKDDKGEPLTVESVVNNERTSEYKMSAEGRAAFLAEYAELLNTDVNVEIRTVKRDLLDRCEESERYSIPTAAQLGAMEFMLKD